MITIHRLNGDPLIINAHLIETIESTPDTVISLTTGRQLVVLDSVEDLIDQVVSYRARIAELGHRAAEVDLHKLIDLGNPELTDFGNEGME